MMRDIHRHVDAEELERYSMGASSEDAESPIEEHLLTCATCQDRLRETDEYLRVMRASSFRLRRDATAAGQHQFQVQAWFPVLVAVACALIVVLAAPRFIRQTGPAVAVSLTAMRGDGTGNIAPTGTDLVVRPDLTGLPEEASYRLVIVDQTGHVVRQGKLMRERKAIQVPGLDSGLYFVRVYLPAGDLLREYGLRIR